MNKSDELRFLPVRILTQTGQNEIIDSLINNGWLLDEFNIANSCTFKLYTKNGFIYE